MEVRTKKSRLLPALAALFMKIRMSLACLAAGCALTLLLAGAVHAAPGGFDIIITHGHIIDGTGSPWYEGDVGIMDGRIAAIGNLSGAARKQTVDAHGMVVAPEIGRAHV